MHPLHAEVDSYVSLRKRLGFKSQEHRERLHEFVDYLDANGDAFVRVVRAIEFAEKYGRTPEARWLRMHTIRCFAKHMAARDGRTEVPPKRAVVRHLRRRVPYLFDDREMARILLTARNIGTDNPYQKRVWYVIYALLAATGIRPGEAVGLLRANVDLEKGLLLVQNTKREKDRIVPIHRTVTRVLRLFADVRDDAFPRRLCDRFFVSIHQQAICKQYLSEVFRRIVRVSGVFSTGLPPGFDWPTPMSFRHRFITRNVERIIARGGDVNVELASLSTYVGHKSFTDTFWYLENTPSLMALMTDKRDTAQLTYES